MAHAEYNPQLATLGSEPPSGDRWLHEIKYDGYADQVQQLYAGMDLRKNY
jgi:ATP-dependent DNA ligase